MIPHANNNDLPPSQRTHTSRRDFLRASTIAAGAAAFGSLALARSVHAAGDDTIRIALVGCGGRGTGAAANALATSSGPIKLVAMADVFAERLKNSHEQLKKECGDKVDVPQDCRFIGFDGYRKAIACLRPGDIVLLTTPPAFRWVQFGHAIEKGVNTFMEKPTTVDGPTTRKMLALAEASQQKNLKVGVGLMTRHCPVRRQLYERIKEGQLGELLMMRTYRMHGPAAFFLSDPKPQGISDLLYQVQRFHSFIWASGGAYSDFYIHNIDECCWMKDAWPVEAQALGGRHFRGNSVDQNFDTYSVEYTFADGAKLFMYGRCIPGCYDQFDSWLHGTKGVASTTGPGMYPARGQLYKGHAPAKSELLWKSSVREGNPYQLEWDHLVEAVRRDQPYNEAKRGAQASLVSSMGRMAAHTGRRVTYDQILNLDYELAPQVDQLAMDSPAPLLAGPDGKYPVPQPGIVTSREY
jgi:predicted dehydrogenase